MRQQLAQTLLLGTLAHTAPLAQRAPRQGDAAGLVLAGTDIEPELLLADAAQGTSLGSQHVRGGRTARQLGVDGNEDQEDYQELTMADLLGGRAVMIGHRWNASLVFRDAIPSALWYARLRGRRSMPKSIEPYEVPAYETEAWATVMYARKLGPHSHVPSAAELTVRLRAFFDSAPAIDWYFLGAFLVVVVAGDIAVLQQLPETSRTHAVLLIFWLLVAIVFSIEIWLRLGPQAGVAWITGYALELIFSLDKIFIVNLLFCTFETPRRLMAKALFVGLLSSIAFRMAFLLGLASVLDSLRVIPYIVGVWLVYCGTRQVTVYEDETVDVTQTAIVRTFRGLLGDRLGEFYDEEGEGIFVASSKGKYCMTLLGVVVLCLLLMDLLLAFDVMLTKSEEVPNAYLSFSSSALAMFAIRAIFSSVRDLFIRYSFMKYGTGLVLIFMGAETLLSHAIYVNALLSCTVIVVIMAFSLLCSWLRSPSPKIVQ